VGYSDGYTPSTYKSVTFTVGFIPFDVSIAKFIVECSFLTGRKQDFCHYREEDTRSACKKCLFLLIVEINKPFWRKMNSLLSNTRAVLIYSWIASFCYLAKYKCWPKVPKIRQGDQLLSLHFGTSQEIKTIYNYPCCLECPKISHEDTVTNPTNLNLQKYCGKINNLTSNALGRPKEQADSNNYPCRLESPKD
jgi:hypothetical protein